MRERQKLLSTDILWDSKEWNASALVHFHYNLLSTSQFVWQMKICTKNAWTMSLVYLESRAQSDIVLLHFAFLSFTFSKIPNFLFLNLNGKESIPDFHCGLILLSLISKTKSCALHFKPESILWEESWHQNTLKPFKNSSEGVCFSLFWRCSTFKSCCTHHLISQWVNSWISQMITSKPSLSLMSY